MFLEKKTKDSPDLLFSCSPVKDLSVCRYKMTSRVTLAAVIWLAASAHPVPATLSAVARNATVDSPHRYEATRLSMACVYAIEAYGPDAAALPPLVSGAAADGEFR